MRAGFCKSSTDFETEVIEIDVFTCENAFTTRLLFSFFRAACDVDSHLHFDFRMQTHRHGVKTDGLDRRMNFDLRTIDRNAFCRNAICDVACCNRTIELTRFTRLTDDDIALAVKLLADGFRILLRFEIAGFKLSALRFEMFDVRLRCTQSFCTWQKEVTSLTILQAHNIAHLTELGNAFQKNDLHDDLLRFVLRVKAAGLRVLIGGEKN